MKNNQHFFELDNLVGQPLYIKIIFIIFMGAIIWLVSYYWEIKPLQDQLSANKIHYFNIIKKIHQQKQLVFKTQKSLLRDRSFNKDHIQKNKFLDEKYCFDNWLQGFFNLAKNNQLTVKQIKILTEHKFNNYSRKNIYLQLQGKYFSLQRFLLQISQLSHLSTVEHLLISLDKRARDLNIELTIGVYKYYEA